MSRLDEGEPLRNFSPPRASEALRARVLSRAREAAAHAVRPSRVDRIWYSKGWRLAWVGALAALILLEALSVRISDSADRAAASRPVSVPESAAAAEALGLPSHRFLGDRVVASDDIGKEAAVEDL